MRSSILEKIKPLEQILAKKADKANNQPVQIRDLIAYQAPGSFGEFELKSSSPQAETEVALITRMSQYIRELAEIAHQQHLKDNFTDTGQMDVKKTNNITRLTLNEFALYPHKNQGPLTQEGFELLLRNIEAIAHYYPDNLHLMLASVPVKTEDGHVLNKTIFVECGKTPSLHTFAKTHPVRSDPCYPGTKNLDFKSSSIPSTVLKQGENTHLSGDFICQTAGGALFHTSAEICIDHAYGIAHKQTKRNLNMVRLTGESIYPTHASHVIMANSIDVDYKFLISQTFILADPNLSETQGQGKIPAESTLHLDNPSFGPKTTIKTYPPRFLKTHRISLDNEIQAHNQFMIRLEALRIYRAQHLMEIDRVDKEIDKHILTLLKDHLDEFFPELKNMIELITRAQILELVRHFESTAMDLDIQITFSIIQNLLETEQHTTENLTKEIKSMQHLPTLEKKNEEKKPSIPLSLPPLSVDTIIQALRTIKNISPPEVKQEINLLINKMLYRDIRENLVAQLKHESEYQQIIQSYIQQLDEIVDFPISFRSKAHEKLLALQKELASFNCESLQNYLININELLVANDNTPPTIIVRDKSLQNRISALLQTEQQLSHLYLARANVDAKEPEQATMQRNHHIHQAEERHTQAGYTLISSAKKIERLQLEGLSQKIVSIINCYQSLIEKKMARGSKLKSINSLIKIIQSDEPPAIKITLLINALKSLWRNQKKQLFSVLSDEQLIHKLNKDMTKNTLTRMIGIVLQNLDQLPDTPIKLIANNESKDSQKNKEQIIVAEYLKYSIQTSILDCKIPETSDQKPAKQTEQKHTYRR